MSYHAVPLPMTFNDLVYHSPIHKPFQVQFFVHIFSSYNTSTDLRASVTAASN